LEVITPNYFLSSEVQNVGSSAHLMIGTYVIIIIDIINC